MNVLRKKQLDRKSLYCRFSLLKITITLLLIFCFLAALTPSLHAQQNDLGTEEYDAWPMFQHDPQHTGYTNSNIPETIRQKWNFTTYGVGAISNPPIVADGIIFFGSEDENFYALNETNGNLIWVRQIGACSASAAVDSSKRLVFVAEYTKGSAIYALDEFTGEIKWQKQAEFDSNYPVNDEDKNRPWYSPPTVDTERGVVYFGGIRYWVDPPDPYYYWARRGATLYCLNSTNGNVVWRKTVDYANMPLSPLPLIYTSPAIGDGRVFFADDGFNTGYSTTGVPLIAPPGLYAVDETTGSLLWSTNLGDWGGDYIRSSPSLAFDKVFIGSSDKNLYVLNASSGTISWQHTTGGAIESSPAIDESKGLTFVGSNDGNLYCLSQVGTLLWTKSFGVPVKSHPILADGKVLLSVNDVLNALNDSTGQDIWSFSSSGNLTSPVVSNGVIFVGSTDGRLYALFSTLKISTSLADPTTTAVFGQSEQILTRLMDTEYAPISNANVTFSIFANTAWTYIGSQVTNSQGYSSISYSPDLPSGIYQLRVDFAGDFFHEPAEFIGTLTVEKEQTSLAFTISPIQVEFSDVVKIESILTNHENNGVEDVTVHYQFFIDGIWEDIGQNSTHSEGLSEISYQANIGYGTYPIRAHFEGNNYYEACITESFLIVEKKIAQLSDPSSVVSYNDVGTIQARLTDNDDNPLVGLPVSFWVYENGVWNIIDSGETNIQGGVEISFLVNLDLGRYDLKVRFEGNDFYTSNESIGILSVYSKLIIDDSYVPQVYAEVGSVQRVYFHTTWQINGSSVDGGVVFINSTQATINSTGWAVIEVTSAQAGLHTFIITSINCNGATIFDQTCQNPYIIWDEITIILSVEYERVNVGTEISIITSANYAYDDQPFNGLITLNDTSFQLSAIGRKHYTVEQVTDPLRELTSFRSNILAVTWDKVEVTLQANRERVNVGEKVSIIFNAFYVYDNEPFVGTINLNDTVFSLQAAGKRSYVVEQIIDEVNSVSSFNSNTLSIIWDKVEVTLSADEQRINTGKLVPITINAFYAYDKQPFRGIVSLNDTSLVFSSPTRKVYTTSQISDSTYGITSFSTNEVSIIWDEVAVTLIADKQRVDVGESIALTWDAEYAYDNQQFSGQIFLNDTVFTLSSVGKKDYTVTRITDNNYGLTQFSSNTVSIIWDKLRVEYSINNPSPGTLEVTVKVHSEYDDTLIKNAELMINGIKAIENSDGTYYCKIPTWVPFFSTELTIDTEDYQSTTHRIEGLPMQNFFVELVLLPLSMLIPAGLLVYRWKRKKEALNRLLEEIDPKVPEIARKYGGVLTISVLALELKTSLGIAEKSLERFVEFEQAQRIVKGDDSFYDFPSARTHLLGNDYVIISALRDNIDGLMRHELLHRTGLKLEPLEKSLTRLESNGIISYDKLSDRYKLRGLETK